MTKLSRCDNIKVVTKLTDVVTRFKFVTPRLKVIKSRRDEIKNRRDEINSRCDEILVVTTRCQVIISGLSIVLLEMCSVEY